MITLDPQIALIIGAIFTGVGTLIASITACIIAVRGNNKINDLHLSINSRMDKYIEEVTLAAEARGVKKEQERLK